MIKTKFEFINEHKTAIRILYINTDWPFNTARHTTTEHYNYGGQIKRFKTGPTFDDPDYWAYSEGILVGDLLSAEVLRQIAGKIDELNEFEKGLSAKDRRARDMGNLEKEPPID